MMVRLFPLLIGLFQPFVLQAQEELSITYVDELITECIAWIDTGDFTYFYSEMHGERGSLRDSIAREMDPERTSDVSGFQSPFLAFAVHTEKHLDETTGPSSCVIIDNVYAAGPDIDGYSFDVLLGGSILSEWGDQRAWLQGFFDVPEDVRISSVKTENVLFEKMRCNNGQLSILIGQSAPELYIIQTLLLPSWRVTIEHYRHQDALSTNGVLAELYAAKCDTI